MIGLTVRVPRIPTSSSPRPLLNPKPPNRKSHLQILRRTTRPLISLATKNDNNNDSSSNELKKQEEESESESESNGGGGWRRLVEGIRWGDLVLSSDPDNIVAVGLTGLLTWASVQVLLQLLFISLAILVAALKYSLIAALLIFILVTLL